MLSYTTSAKIKADNAAADRVMKSLGHDGVIGASKTDGAFEKAAASYSEVLERRIG